MTEVEMDWLMYLARSEHEQSTTIVKGIVGLNKASCRGNLYCGKNN